MPDEDADDGCIAVNLTALEVSVRVNVRGRSRCSLAADLRRAWSRCLAEPGADAQPGGVVVEVFADPDIDVVRGSGVAVASTDQARLMDVISSTVTVAAIERQAGRLLMLHACGLADPRSGRTVALVAPSGTGKTTAASTLGRSLGYVTDETVGVRSDGSVVAYPKPLSVITDPTDPVKRQVDPGELGLLDHPRDLALASILWLQREPHGPRQPAVDEFSTVQALAQLSPQISSLTRFDRPLHRVVSHLHATGGLRRVRYREIEDVLPLVAELAVGGA